jgi:hypothetical protein
VLEAASAISGWEGRNNLLGSPRVCRGRLYWPLFAIEGFGFCTDHSVEACGGSERRSVEVPAASNLKLESWASRSNA